MKVYLAEKDLGALLMRRNFGHGQRNDSERGIYVKAYEQLLSNDASYVPCCSSHQGRVISCFK
jgi:hypothetical protein